MTRTAAKLIKEAITTNRTLDRPILIAYICERLMNMYVDGRDPDFGDHLDHYTERMGMSTTWDIDDRIEEYVETHENFIRSLGLLDVFDLEDARDD